MTSATSASLEGKAILITGGSLGLGYASALACARRGARIAICARDHAALDRAQRALQKETPFPVLSTMGDVSVGRDVDAVVREVAERFGRLDGVIHAAAVLGPIGSVLTIDPGEWLRTIEIDLFGTFLVTRAAARTMAQTGGGRIVLYSGGGATSPYPNYSAYAASKAAVVRFAETVALELAPQQIAVNALAPGFVATRMHDETLAAGPAGAGRENFEKTQAELARGGVPASVGADCAAFLVSDAAAGITGKLVAAPYDGFEMWTRHLAALRDTDVFTLRRILPCERGMDWQ